MSTKLLPSQLSYEDLLAILESEDEDIQSAVDLDYENDIVKFLAYYKITPGNTPVSKKLLYSLYKTYSVEPRSSIQFALEAGKFIEPRGFYYYLNQDNFAISHHIYATKTRIDKTKRDVYQKHFKWFVDTRKVERGSTWTEGFVLFFIYKDFCKSHRVHPKLGYRSFHKFLKLHFEFKRVSENRALWFKVDEDTNKLLTEQEKDIIREHRKKAGRSKENEKPESEAETE